MADLTGLLAPKLERRVFLAVLRATALGALLGGLYGLAHDLLTYRISPEYYTKLKFAQFAWADLGLPPMWHAAEIGVIAGAAVGAIAGWFLGRVLFPQRLSPEALRLLRHNLLVTLSFAAGGGCIGYTLGLPLQHDFSAWAELCGVLGVTDIRAFARVAYIHNGGYIGGSIGLIVAIILLRRSGHRRIHA